MSISVVMTICNLVFFTVFTMICASRKYKITKAWYVFSILLTICLASMAYNLEPNKRLDLYRLQLLVNKMRLSNESPLTLILEGVSNQYEGLVTFNILCYISSILGNQWMQTISVLITIPLLMYVILSFLRDEGYSCNAILPSICMTFMGLQLHYVFSGIRNAIAVALTVFALYRIYRYNRILFSSLVIYIFAIMMHPVVVIVAPVLVLAIYGKKQRLLRIIALFAIPIIFAVAKVFTTIPITLFQYIGNRVYYYEDHSYAADRPEMIANIAMFLAIGLSYWWFNKENSFGKLSNKEKVYVNFYYLLGFVMLGCVMKRDFINRIGYIMGILSVPLISKIFFGIKRHRSYSNTKIIWVALSFALLVCCGKVFYDTLWVLTKWTFT